MDTDDLYGAARDAMARYLVERFPNLGEREATQIAYEHLDEAHDKAFYLTRER